MYIGIVFNFCQTRDTLDHWTWQIPWQYFVSEICTTTIILGGQELCVLPCPKVGRLGPCLNLPCF